MKRRIFMASAAALALPAQAQAIKRDWPASKRTPTLDLPGFKPADMKGKVLLLNFWASWCEPCRAEMPALELLEQRYEAQGLKVLAINYRETDAAMQRFLQVMPMSFTVLRDADGAMAKAFDVRIFPSTIAIDRKGRVAFSIIGAPEWDGPEARAWLAPLFSGEKK